MSQKFVDLGTKGLHLSFEAQTGVLTVAISRPEVRNAFNDELVLDFGRVFKDAAKDPDVRAIVLRGEGPVFCAGGDLNWLKSMVDHSAEENLVGTRALAQMFEALNTIPKPLVGVVHGAAIGGGVGLVSVCDYVIASQETVFSLAEVRLGIIPACIGPFVIAKVGESHARAMFITAERFGAARALQMGLIHEIVESPGDLDVSLGRLVGNLVEAGPNAVRVAKELIRNLSRNSVADRLDYVARTLADLTVTPEGQEGMKAFLAKRKPSWVPK